MEDVNAPATDEAQIEGVELLVMAAQLVLENGGETYRVEETVRRMAKGLGLENVSSVAFPTSIFVANGKGAQIRRVSRRGTNMARLVRVNDVSRRVEHGEMDAAMARKELESIAAMPGSPQRHLLLTYGLTAASFSLLFGGGAPTFVVSFLLGVIVQLVQPFFSRLEMGNLLGNFAGGFLVSLLANLIGTRVFYGDINAAIVGGIMPMLTGLLMTTAMRDTMYGDLVSGVARAVEALLLAGSVALGVYVGLKFFGVLGGLLL